MNKRQRWIVQGALTSAVVMFLFPPFHLPLNAGRVINLGYGFLFSPPTQGYYAGTVNIGMLVAQWALVAIVAAVLWWLEKAKT